MFRYSNTRSIISSAVGDREDELELDSSTDDIIYEIINFLFKEKLFKNKTQNTYITSNQIYLLIESTFDEDTDDLKDSVMYQIDSLLKDRHLQHHKVANVYKNYLNKFLNVELCDTGILICWTYLQALLKDIIIQSINSSISDKEENGEEYEDGDFVSLCESNIVYVLEHDRELSEYFEELL
jgi:hypothetical protein